MGKLRITENCIGCMACVSINPEVFEMNEEQTKAIVKLDIQALEKYKNYIKGTDTDTDTAIEACPAGAIVNND